MTAYYNEHNKAKAAWLREAIAQGVIADGEVDERSIEDVAPADLAGFTQCHFFAGIGGWSIALRLAGWPDDWGIWSASCPCQPFSAAGKGVGFADERHLWPAYHHLHTHGKPPAVPAIGEQVASKDGFSWLDLVSADLEGSGNAVGAVDSCSAGFGAPHIRQRLYWVADPAGSGHQGRGPAWPARPRREGAALERGLSVGGLADSRRAKLQAGRIPQDHEPGTGSLGKECTCRDESAPCGTTGGLGDTPGGGRGERGHAACAGCGGHADGAVAPDRPGPVNGSWGVADWLWCRDGCFRPVEPGTFPLAHGLPLSFRRMQPELRRLAELAGLDAKSLARAKANRIVRLLGYGDAINVIQAAAFVKAYMEEKGLSS